MGILNVTPDSFSDGGKFVKAEAAIAAALQMQSDGADIIDIGGESTRPGSRPVSAADEIARVIPVIEGLGGRLSVPISIDTSKASVAEAAIAAGAELINDVTGLTGDAAMVDLATGSGVGVCVMHMKGTPQTMQDDPAYDDVVEEIADYLVRRFDHCVQRGIRPDRICLDPGVGFGKNSSAQFDAAAGDRPLRSDRFAYPGRAFPQRFHRQAPRRQVGRSYRRDPWCLARRRSRRGARHPSA